jgi:hypothetical protein
MMDTLSEMEDQQQQCSTVTMEMDVMDFYDILNGGIHLPELMVFMRNRFAIKEMTCLYELFQLSHQIFRLRKLYGIQGGAMQPTLSPSSLSLRGKRRKKSHQSRERERSRGQQQQQHRQLYETNDDGEDDNRNFLSSDEEKERKQNKQQQQQQQQQEREQEQLLDEQQQHLNRFRETCKVFDRYWSYASVKRFVRMYIDPSEAKLLIDDFSNLRSDSRWEYAYTNLKPLMQDILRFCRQYDATTNKLQHTRDEIQQSTEILHRIYDIGSGETAKSTNNNVIDINVSLQNSDTDSNDSTSNSNVIKKKNRRKRGRKDDSNGGGGGGSRKEQKNTSVATTTLKNKHHSGTLTRGHESPSRILFSSSKRNRDNNGVNDNSDGNSGNTVTNTQHDPSFEKGGKHAVMEQERELLIQRAKIMAALNRLRGELLQNITLKYWSDFSQHIHNTSSSSTSSYYNNNNNNDNSSTTTTTDI